MRFGTETSANAPVEETMRASSISTPFSGMTSDPVAITTCVAVTVSIPASPTMLSVCASTNCALPFSQSILFFLNRYATPSVLALTTLSLNPCIRSSCSSTPETDTPIWSRWFFARSYFSDDCSSAFEGMQPILRHVPPSVARFSTQAVLNPSCAARIAQT